jgi:ADP-ribose pyrophosphatase
MTEGPQRLARTTFYESPWVTMHLDTVRLPSGAVIDPHHVLDFPDSVAAIVTDGAGQILLIESYRYTVGRSGWEIPAGRVEHGESMVEAARRETREETGYDSVGHELLYTYNPLIGIATGEFGIVRCRATDAVGDFDHDEVKQVRWVPAAEVEKMISDQLIYDGYTLTALLLHQNRQQ